MVRSTSVLAFRQIESEGLLSKLRWEVYSFLFHNGPLTCREFLMKIQEQRGNIYIAGGSLSSRFSELERQGAVSIVQRRPCKQTGRMAIEWDVTDRIPQPLQREQKPTYKQLVAELKELRSRCSCGSVQQN